MQSLGFYKMCSTKLYKRCVRSSFIEIEALYLVSSADNNNLCSQEELEGGPQPDKYLIDHKGYIVYSNTGLGDQQFFGVVEGAAFRIIVKQGYYTGTASRVETILPAAS